jgi:long-chain acyl-CoA synthetase
VTTLSEFLKKLIMLRSNSSGEVAIVRDGRSITYGDLQPLVIASAGWLAARGVRPGQVVAISVDDDMAHLVFALGLLAVGAWQVNTASHEAPATRADLAKRTRATVQLTSSAEFAIPGLDHIFWNGDLCFEGGIYVVPTGGGGGFFSTSGTTGTQSIVQMDEALLVEQASRGFVDPGDGLFKAASMEFGHVKRNRLFAVWSGSRNILRASRDSSRLSVWLSQSGATVVDVSRVALTGLLADKAGGLPLSMTLRVEGSMIPADLRDRVMRELTRNFYVRYASTETGSISLAKPQDHVNEGTLGVPAQDVEIAIFSANGEASQSGEVGEIWLKTPGMVNSYFDDPAKTAVRFSDGWFRPGDLGRFLPDGQLILMGRKDDMINMSGIKIFPIEIERVLSSHPDVVAVAVFPFPSKVHGHIPVAALELRADAMDRRDEILANLMKSSRAKLGIRAPRKLIAYEYLPRNAMGKILTRDLLLNFEGLT